jgi:hypothetical protein
VENDLVRLQNLYFLSGIIRMIKSKKIRRLEREEHVGKKRNVYRVFVGKPEIKIEREA